MMKPLRTKTATRNAIYKMVTPLTVGFFKDNSWGWIRQIWDRLESEGVTVTINDTKYDGFKSKTWNFTLSVNGFSFNGYLVASFCGTNEDPTGRYDLSFIV